MEQKIVREEQIMVVASNENQYGDLIVKGNNDKEYKIAGKRKHLWELFKIGNSVTLKFGNYMNKDFVADATLGSKPTQQKTEQPKPVTVPLLNRPEPTVSGPEHGMALKLVCDLYIAGKLEDGDALVVVMFSELQRIMGVEN